MIIHDYYFCLTTIESEHKAVRTKKGWSAYNLYIWHWESKLLTYIIRQLTDIPPTMNGQRIGRVSAEISTEIAADSRRYFDHHSADISDDISVDMSTDIFRSLYRPSVGRHVDRHIGGVSVDMSTDISVEGCTKHTWFRPSGTSQWQSWTETVHSFYFLQNWDRNRILLFCLRENEM